MANRVFDETAKALRWSAVYNSSFRQETHYWVNETGIYNQFYCHVNIAGLKPTWHLEPLRPDYGYGYTLPWDVIQNEKTLFLIACSAIVASSLVLF